MTLWTGSVPSGAAAHTILFLQGNLRRSSTLWAEYVCTSVSGADGTFRWNKGNGVSAYFRTKDRKTPHNAYASGPKLRQAIEASGYADAYPESYEGHYTFAPESAPVCFEDGIAAAKVVPGYQLSNPWFEYHPEDGLYYRYQYGGPHMGDEGQIAVKNIIFQYCLWKYYKPTEYLDIEVHTPATGYYFTNGHGILIRWEKDGAYGVTKYYDMDGQEIKLNPGKTWVCILPNDRMVRRNSMENRRSRRKPGMREETEREIISRQRTAGRREEAPEAAGKVRAEAVTGQEAAGSRKRFR